MICRRSDSQIQLKIRLAVIRLCTAKEMNKIIANSGIKLRGMEIRIWQAYQDFSPFQKIKYNKISLEIGGGVFEGNWQAWKTLIIFWYMWSNAKLCEVFDGKS